MFGHQDDEPDHHDDQPVENVLTNAAANDMTQSDQGAPALGDESVVSDDFNPALPPVPAAPPAITSHGQDLGTTAPSSDDSASDTDDGKNTDEPVTVAAAPLQAAGSNRDTDTPSSANPDLMDIKLQALNQLSPLVDHLEQTPEEKFRTTMMMIQAADNQGLIKTAYEAAQAIPDEKVKAQALLDIVNEINYFTQKNS